MLKKIIRFCTKPFKWIWVNIRDWKTFLIFIIVFLVLSSEVWVFYLLGIIFNGSAFSAWCFSIASVCWLFWLGPFTPFLPLCIGITFGIKALLNKIKIYRLRKNLLLPAIIYKKLF